MTTTSCFWVLWIGTFHFAGADQQCVWQYYKMGSWRGTVWNTIETKLWLAKEAAFSDQLGKGVVFCHRHAALHRDRSHDNDAQNCRCRSCSSFHCTNEVHL